MRRIALAMLLLLAVACSKDIDEVNIDPTSEENPVVDTPGETSKEDPEETSKEDPEEPVANTPPTFEIRTFTIDEHSLAGSFVGTVSANDSDDDQLSYTLESDIDLIIDDTTGLITLGDQLRLDFETAETLSFTVSAFDGRAITEMTFELQVQDVDELSILTQEEEALIEHFQYLTLWQGPHVTEVETNRRWNEPVQIYLDGTISSAFKANVDEVLADYNALFEEGDFSLSLTEDAEAANGYIFFGTKEEVETVWPDMYDIIKDGNYSGYAMSPSRNSVLIATRIWISNPIAALLKHEVGHALGLGHSNRCDDENSIMCSQISADSDFTNVEADVLRLLYHQDFAAGLTATDIATRLAHLIVNRR